ncbi:MAG TPA: amidohydrolase family protein [Bacteroidales bacterium]|nr:amidohydrolase family protein [Bacteroidales bacterium]
MIKLDAHQHFWLYNPDEYAWIGENMKVLQNDFLPMQLQKELDSMSFDGSIVVQARQTLEETEWLLKLASEYDFIKGVVGWVDLCSDDIENQLKKYSDNPKFVGVRHVVHDEPDDYFMARADFQHGISLLEKYNLTYDLLLFPKHLPLATELVRKFPNQRFILDHIAKPLIKGQVKEPWASEITKLAQWPNVYCKLSGMVTEADWQNWKAPDFAYYLETVYQAFGSNRLMIGSDWPVCTVAGGYQQVMCVVTDFIKQFDDDVQKKILGMNCYRFYLSKIQY